MPATAWLRPSARTVPRLLAVGAGYAVRPLLAQLAEEGWSVTATTRDPEKAETLRRAGITPLIWTAPAPLPRADADAIIVSVAPKDGCPALSALDPTSIRRGTRLLYLSASSVYGDHGGAWVDETTPPMPGTARGQARVAAEQGWQAFAAACDARLTLCRLAGIYGPGRNALESLSGATRGARAGLSQRVIKPGHVFSRIHRADIGAGLRAVLVADAPPGIVNFADDEPAPPQDVIAYAADLLGLACPPGIAIEDAKLSDMARSFYAENKRVRADRLEALMGPLRYPTYREGLDALALTRRSRSHPPYPCRSPS